MTSPIRKMLTLAALTATLVTVSGNVFADTRFQQTHPRREQVNNRLANQSRRINGELKEGEITKQQAAYLHHEDHQIRSEERFDARLNGGHITRAEQASLNQQENSVSNQIGK